MPTINFNPQIKKQVSEVLDKKVKARLRAEAETLLRKDMNAYNTLSSSGVASSTGVAAEDEKDDKKKK